MSQKLFSWFKCFPFYESNYAFVKRDREPITKSTIDNLFRRLKRRSGITRIYPHLLRHTFATSYMLGGGDLETLRLLMGHSDYTVTQNYLHLATQYKFMKSNIYQLDDIFFRKGY